MSEASNSLVTNANMMGKIYFPRLIVPASAVIVGFVDLLISPVILAGADGVVSCHADWRLVCSAAVHGLGFWRASASGFWLAALNVKYRDFRYVIPFVVQFGLFVSPVGFSRDQLVIKNWATLARVLNSIP